LRVIVLGGTTTVWVDVDEVVYVDVVVDVCVYV